MSVSPSFKRFALLLILAIAAVALLLSVIIRRRARPQRQREAMEVEEGGLARVRHRRPGAIARRDVERRELPPLPLTLSREEEDAGLPPRPEPPRVHPKDRPSPRNIEEQIKPTLERANRKMDRLFGDSITPEQRKAVLQAISRSRRTIIQNSRQFREGERTEEEALRVAAGAARQLVRDVAKVLTDDMFRRMMNLEPGADPVVGMPFFKDESPNRSEPLPEDDESLPPGAKGEGTE